MSNQRHPIGPTALIHHGFCFVSTGAKSEQGGGPGEADSREEAFFVIDVQQRVVGWSDAAAQRLGLPEDATLGKSCYEVLQGRSPFGKVLCRADCSPINALRSGHMTARCSMTVANGSSARRRLTAELVAIPTPPGGAAAWLVENGSGRRDSNGGAPARADAPLETTTDVLRDLSSLGALSTLLSPDDLGRSIEQALDWLRQELDAEAAELFLGEAQGRDLLLSAYSGPFKSAFTEITRFRPGEGFPGLVSTNGEPILTHHLGGDSRYLRSRVKQKGFNSYACVPLMTADGVMGTLSAASRRTDLDLERALTLMTWASRPVGNMLRAGLSQIRDRIQPEASVSPRDAEGSLDRLMRAVLGQMMALGQSDGGALLLYDRHVEGVVRRVTQGELSGMLCPDITGGSPQNCPSLVGKHGVALHGPRRLWPPNCHQAPTGAAMIYCLPLVVADQEVGIVQLAYAEGLPSPTTKFLPLLLNLAERAAGAINAAWLNLQIQQTAHDPRMIQPVALPALTVSEEAGESQEHSRKLSPADAGPAQPWLSVRCLGTFELYQQGRLVTPSMFSRRGALTLLKILLIREGRPISRDALTELLWPESDPQAAANRLYVLVHALRQIVEPSPRDKNWLYVRSDGDRYYLDREAQYELDVEEFRKSVSIGNQLERDGSVDEAIRSYERAMALYRGDLLEEEPYADWCWAEREDLKEICLALLNKLADHYLKQDSFEESINYYRRALKVDPLRERSHRGLMRALWQAGRRDEALRQYQACQTILRRELDLEPLAETQRLYLRIRGD